jgi:hypothetical protein
MVCRRGWTAGLLIGRQLGGGGTVFFFFVDATVAAPLRLVGRKRFAAPALLASAGPRAVTRRPAPTPALGIRRHGLVILTVVELLIVQKLQEVSVQEVVVIVGTIVIIVVVVVVVVVVVGAVTKTVLAAPRCAFDDGGRLIV